MLEDNRNISNVLDRVPGLVFGGFFFTRSAHTATIMACNPFGPVRKHVPRVFYNFVLLNSSIYTSASSILSVCLMSFFFYFFFKFFFFSPYLFIVFFFFLFIFRRLSCHRPATRRRACVSRPDPITRLPCFIVIYPEGSTGELLRVCPITRRPARRRWICVGAAEDFRADGSPFFGLHHRSG